MASGRTHDVINLIAFAPIAYYFQPEDFIPFALGYLIGTFFLSPDNDLYHSKPVKRWKFLRFIWYPLAKLSKHRGLSHIPIIGSLIRLGYLFLIFSGLYLIAVYVASYLGVSYISTLDLKSIVLSIHFISFFLGLVCAEIVHILVDITYSFLKKMRLIR